MKILPQACLGFFLLIEKRLPHLGDIKSSCSPVLSHHESTFNAAY